MKWNEKLNSSQTVGFAESVARRMSAKTVDPSQRKVAILVEDLRLWILSQPHLSSRISDEFLRGFLRGCFYSLDETKRRIDLYYTLKNEIPSVLANRRVTRKLLDVCQTGVIISLPRYINGKGACLYLSKYANYDPSTYTYAEIMKVFFMLMEIEMMECRNARPYSIVHVIDLKGATFKHCLQFNLCLTRRIIRLMKDGLPMQINEIHIINASNCFVRLLSFMCSFMSKELRQRYYIHDSKESLYKQIPQLYLPIEYGGRNGSIQRCINMQIEKLLEHEAYFEEDHLYGVNESLRRKKG